MKFSACIEMLFADETPDFADRIRLAKKAGFDAVEFWKWTNKDLDAMEAAVRETGIAVAGCVGEPMIPLTDATNQAAFLDGLRRSIAVARRFGAGVLIVQAGPYLAAKSRAEQRAALVDCLKAAADILDGTGVRVGLEPLNTLVDHKGYFLDSTAEAVEIMDEIGRPEIGLTYDVYHSAVMGENTAEVLANGMKHVFHVHIADHPGRNDPGTGGIDLAERLKWLFAHGYSGYVGFEYRSLGRTSETVGKAMAQLAAG